MAGKPNRTSRIARFAGLAITVAGMAFATASWASITSSENPSTDGSYTISWSAVPNASSHQLYEDGTLVYDSTGTSWSVSGKAAGDYEYTVGYCEFIFDEEMCFGSGYTALTVTVSSAPPPTPAPTVTASFDESSITRGESVELTWSSTNASACSGAPSIGSTATSGEKTYTPTSAGSFSVEVTCTGAGGSASDTAGVTVTEPLPTVSAEFDESSITRGDDVELTWRSTNASACSGAPSIGSTATSGEKTYTPTSAGRFSVKVTCTGAGGSASDAAGVTVTEPLPTVSAEFDESSITRGDDVELTWRSTNASACSGAPSIGSTETSGEKTYTPTSAGSFSVEVTCTGAGGSASDAAGVTVTEPLPTVSAEFDESSITRGDDVELTWRSTNASACSGAPSIGSTETSGEKTYTPTSAGSFSVEVTCTGAGGSASDTAGVTVTEPLPTVSAEFGESSITRGDDVELTWRSTNASACSGAPSIGSTETSGRKTYTLTSAGSFSVEVTCTGAGGRASDTAGVTVTEPLPTVSAEFGESSITRGDDVELTWRSTNATRCSGAPSIGSTETSGRKTYTPTSAGRFSVTVTCTGAGGSAIETAGVTVTEPLPTVSAEFGESSITRGESVELTWRSTNATRCSGAPSIGSTETSGRKTYTPTSAGRFSVKVTCTGAGGSASETAGVTVNEPRPTVDAWFNSSSITLGNNVTLNWSSTNASACSGSPSISSTSTSGTKSYTPSSTGSFWVRVTCTGAGGSDSDLARVTVYAPPAPTLTAPPTDPDGSYTVRWTSVSGATSYKLEEKSGSGSFRNVYTGSGTSKSFAGKTPAIYTYQVRACVGECSVWSSTDPTKVPPGAPTLTVPATDADGRFRVIWTSPSGATSYKLEEKSGSGSFRNVYSGSTTSTNITDKSDGTYTYQVRASAGMGNYGDWSSTASVEVSINNAPAAVDDAARTPFGTAVVIAVLANDTDADADDLAVTAVTTPASGSVTITSDDDGNNTQVTYTPQSGHPGADTFDYTVSDGTDSDNGTVSVTVDLVTVTPNPSTTGSYTLSWDGSPLLADRYRVLESAAGGTPSLSYHLGTSAQYSGKASGNYYYLVERCETPLGELEECVERGRATATVELPPPPVVTASFDRSSITLGGSVTLTWSSSNSSQCSGSPSIDSMATSGMKTYTPSSAGSFGVTVTCEGAGGSGSATASVAVNTPPVAADDTARTPFGTAVEIAVLANDTDADGDDLTVTVVTMPANGTATITSDANGNDTQVTYTPRSGYSGADTFDYTVSDGTDTDTASVSVTVEPRPNRAPVAADDTARTPFGTAVEIAVLANDTDADGDDLTVTVVTMPANGTATITSDANGNDTQVTYTPRSGFSGADTFDYTVSDGTAIDTANVSVTVNGRAEVAAEFDQSVITLGDSVTLSWSSSNTSQCSGMPSIDSTATDGMKTYTPSSAGIFEVTVTCTGTGGGESVSDNARVTVNAPPVAVDDTARTPFDTAVEIAVLANDTDADGDDLAVAAVTAPANGTATITSDTDGDNTLITYTPGSGYSGADAFDYTVSDGAASATASVSVTVEPRPNRVPVAVDDTARTPFDTAVEIAVLANDTDADGDDLTVTLVTAPANGTATITSDADGNNTRVTYTPRSGHSGADTFDYTVSDGTASDTASVSVTVEARPNSAPVAVDDAARTPFGTAVMIAVLANDTDADGDALTVTDVTTPDDGTVTITSDADGNDTLVTYTPGSDHPGTDTFDYTVSDGTDTDTGTVEVTVDRVKVTPNPSTTGSYRLSWDGTALLADWYRVLEGAGDGAPPVSSEHLGTSVEYTGKATGNYYYTVEGCTQSFEEDETCEELGNATARVVLPITPGNVPYRSGVTKGGDAYVNVPIAPVPGVNGLAPRLSIDYSGGRERHRSDQELPADMIGYGWRVGGFSTIRRCVKGTTDSDGISFDSNDALCLDGEPLTKISGMPLEGDAEYRTARESFAKVLLIENAPGHDWFEVHLPDGTVREYGHTADSQLWKPAREASGTEPAAPAAPFLWSINRQTDAFGNFMTYEYDEDNTSLARHPKKVGYGNGDPGDATIEFVYKPRDDLDSTQVGGFSLAQPQRLTYIHLRLGGSLVRDYRLAYKRTSAGQVRLNEVQTCGYEPSGTYHCLSPLEIGWQDVAGGTFVGQLTDPMGVATTFAIGTLTESDAHDFALTATDTPFGATSLPANTRALPARDGDVKPVVTGVTRSDGIGGTRRTSYAYLGRGVESTRNWGFLGFHAIRETDAASDIVTYTQYRLDHPFLGRPAQVVRYEGNYAPPPSAKTPLSKRAVRYAEKTVSHASSTVTTTLPYAEEAMEWLYEGTSTLGAVQTTEALTLTPAQAGEPVPEGFVTRVVRETRTGHGAPGDGDSGTDWGAGESHTLSEVKRTTQQTLLFDNDEPNWVLGFVGNIDVKHYGADSGDTRGTLDWTETVGRTAIAGKLVPDAVTRFPGDDLQHRTDYVYDTRGNRKTASETEGVPASNTGGQSSQTADDSTRTWKVLGFGAGRFPTSWQNPLDHTEYATHHAGLGVPATTTDANNRRTSYAYDGLGRETSRTRHWDSVETEKDGVTTTTDVKTTTTYASCDDANACDAVEAPVAGCGSSYSVAPVMKVTTTAPDMPYSTAYLDMYGRAIRTAVEGFGGVERRADVFYDARGRAACESEPYHAGETARYTRYTYDIRDRLKVATRPDGGVTGVEYAAASNRVTATVTETVMPSSGTMPAATRETKRTHNVLGELASTTEGAEQTDAAEPVETRYAYDGAGRLKTVTVEGRTTTFAYDAAGNRASVTNPNLGAAVSAGTDMATDMVSVKFEYNGHGELTERKDARGATYYAYDDLGRRTCAADRGGTATWEYDTLNATGLLERRSYDRDTVLTSAASCALGSDFAETYAYNADARLTTVTTSIVDDQDPATTTTLTRSYGYDDYGRLASTTYPSSVATAAVRVDYEYNRHGYAAKLLHGETELVKVTAQTAYGQSKTVNYGNGVETERSYDELGRLAGIETTRGTVTLQDNAYAWRSDGSLESRTAGVAGSRLKRKESFDYDYLNRLTRATTHISDSATASRTLTFGYDLRGNLKTKTSDVPADKSTTGYDYDSGTNRLREATIGDVPYEFPHDTSGHIEQYACTDDDEDDENDCAGVDDTFIDWNARGLAEKVTVGESKTDATPEARDSFRHGPDGARYFKKSEWEVESGATTTMKTSRKYYAGAYEKTVTVGGDTVERTRIGDSVVHVRTTPAGMMPTATSVFEYVHRDHLGSVEAVTNQAGAELVVLGHDPHGERRKNDWTARLTRAEIETLLGGHGERVSRGFTRHEHLDRTGLIHMNGRVYDPRLGRFLSPDPIVGDPTSSQSWNLYSYVGNNPLSYVDPTGLYPECDWVCEADMDAWWDWFDFLNSWWDIPHGRSDYYDGASDPYSASDYVSTRSKAESTLRAMDQSVADEPADSGILAALGELIAGWWRGLPERKYAEMKADCERIHGVGGCEGTSIKDLAPVFGEATGQLGAAGVGKVVAGAASRTTIRAGASTRHVPKATPDVFRRTPNTLSEKLALDEAKGGAGRKIMDGLNDPRFKGMEKWSHRRHNPGGTSTEIHYVRDPRTGKLMDFKFKD